MQNPQDLHVPKTFFTSLFFHNPNRTKETRQKYSRKQEKWGSKHLKVGHKYTRQKIPTPEITRTIIKQDNTEITRTPVHQKSVPEYQEDNRYRDDLKYREIPSKP